VSAERRKGRIVWEGGATTPFNDIFFFESLPSLVIYELNLVCLGMVRLGTWGLGEPKKSV
jgi:hypothetical protein